MGETVTKITYKMEESDPWFQVHIYTCAKIFFWSIPQRPIYFSLYRDANEFNLGAQKVYIN